MTNVAVGSCSKVFAVKIEWAKYERYVLPVATLQSCISLHLFGVSHIKLGAEVLFKSLMRALSHPFGPFIAEKLAAP
jgi:hypothetical protein